MWHLQINDLLRDGKIPIIVGGTNYYIESLLWKVLLQDEQRQCGEQSNDDLLTYERDDVYRSQTTKNPNRGENVDDLLFTQDGLDHLTSDALHEMLARVDPSMAATLHPNNRRKIIR